MDCMAEAEFPVAQVEILNFNALRNGDEQEGARLLRACLENGFFYFDMNGTAPGIDSAVEDIYQLSRELFALAEDELMQYDIDKLSPQKLNGHLSSPDLIRLLKYHAQPLSEQGSSHVPHTDLGSLTFLFTKKYGLQIQSARTGNWEYMQPKEGYTTVNIGDCLSLLTNNKLRSCRHRVKALPGQAMQERYSFAYFMRPDEDALLKAVTSPLIPKVIQEEVFTTKEWLQKKYAMLRRDTWQEDKNWILNGA
ncbi:MAG: hypothetical protein Q9167_001828 [Letrouitia subvulpina]